ncbi:MAG TPA: Gmad2 immunoglobulin-like domain-containing protein [Ornithinimicrobium sp.]|uniref:LysM peptidoglycan-binding domain-containing protein n=1 Tax=Ornithinimicrobium sp. TaxID=1977084 RepID=UPI002B472560|nr:Gmad2 immunoglobulin-like domain-containing protein [Ornithinimicrobium sp.]HKJ12888.1 Gmad2 immunoglobulin-like domain-containing protein [Ornithinimicrobium sp.]
MSIIVQQPQPYDLVSDVIQVSGIAGGAFEAHFQYEVTEGHDSVTGFFTAGDGAGGHDQFQIQVDVSGAGFTLPRLFLHVFHVPPTENPVRTDEVIVPVLHGNQIMADYRVYDEYVVRSGDTLWSIAQDRLGAGAQYPQLVAANAHTIVDPDAISVGQLIRIPRAV